MLIGLDMHGDDFRAEPGGELEALFGDGTPTVDGDNHDRADGMAGGYDRHWTGGDRRDAVIVAPHNHEKVDQERNKDHRDPGAFHELCDQDHDDGDAGDETA